MNLRTVAAVAGCALLAGCGLFPPLGTVEPAPAVQLAPTVAPVEPPRPAAELENLLTYFLQLKRLVGPELGREHDAARLAYSRARSDYNRVRFAMVLALPNTAFNDEGRALEVLEPVAKNQASSLHGLAQLLSAHLQEQRRLAANVQGLQQKLDALRTLERTLIERESGAATRKR
ncbi:MAG: hypothetical protein FJY54_07405 [Betaproteobacteria bacterium]|nr:hypothetical protein [Betaproteobacteria bacterium]